MVLVTPASQQTLSVQYNVQAVDGSTPSQPFSRDPGDDDFVVPNVETGIYEIDQAAVGLIDPDLLTGGAFADRFIRAFTVFVLDPTNVTVDIVDGSDPSRSLGPPIVSGGAATPDKPLFIEGLFYCPQGALIRVVADTPALANAVRLRILVEPDEFGEEQGAAGATGATGAQGAGGAQGPPGQTFPVTQNELADEVGILPRRITFTHDDFPAAPGDTDLLLGPITPALAEAVSNFVVITEVFDNVPEIEIGIQGDSDAIQGAGDNTPGTLGTYSSNEYVPGVGGQQLFVRLRTTGGGQPTTGEAIVFVGLVKPVQPSAGGSA